MQFGGLEPPFRRIAGESRYHVRGGENHATLRGCIRCVGGTMAEFYNQA